ncbi:DUF3857 domain-containing protein [Qipengyuania vesicularis]|uniref:DUF3857 domain-containing protein n=1 Tax=Qipengyuania vesicularis TaxID=2867232 RepID=UPI001C887A4A|nr:DUF3857 domain-containing protein [Qipengyuania vesicularis]MBX7527061.1 DUF3857 domain-containing protein [Qipengyuania vesicularis]
MNDKSITRPFRCALLAGSVLFCGFSAPAFAGEEILYGDIPAWVEEAPLDPTKVKDGPAQLVFDWQHRLEDGIVTTYGDRATRIDNPQALMENGTLSLGWLPDKGDLTIHRLQILRDGKTIDVLGEGAEFDVLRREQGLEQRLLDGQLTATLAVPGLQVGDVLRLTHSVTVDDQALGDEMQVLQYLGTEPWQVGFARTIVSWPTDEEVYWRAEDHAAIGEPVEENGIRKIEVTLPLAEMPEMPYDAPSRYRRANVLRVGTYADWQELSRTMEPHFSKAAQIAPDSEIARQAASIMGKTRDPLRRAALATQLVQDEISYLLNGLDGGNYLPQDAEETWEKRYGDCKAKSVLLHALLSEMGIDSQVVLVQTRGGDAVAELLPIPGNFDHMIVRARIDDQDYWLDGTSTATRIGNVSWVPAFYYALPLTEDGADLVAMSQREQESPNMVMSVVSDYSAGIDLPALFSLEVKFYGPQSAALRQLVDEGDENQLKRIGKSFASGEGSGTVSSVSIDYNEEEAFGTMSVSGITSSDFEWKDGRLILDSDMAPAATFDATRAKPEWRNIPVFTAGPMRNRILGEMILPKGMSGFVFEGEENLEATYANTRISANSSLDGNRFTGQVEVIQTLGEIAPDQLPEIKRAARRFASKESRLIAPEDIVWRWELSRKDLDDRAEPIIEAYGKAIEFAEEDDYGPLQERAGFLHEIYRFEDALVDLDRLVEEDTSAWVLAWRSNVQQSLGRTEEGLADLQRAYDLEPDNNTAMTLAERMAYAGKTDEAIELLESLPISEEETSFFAGTLATVKGLAGDLAGGLSIMAEEVKDKPQNATALNSDCWYRGLFNTGLEGALDICTRAIERATNSAPMLDSRAMVHYRMGNPQAALADLDSALELSPGLAASHYLRGAIRLEQGDKRGKEDIEIALRIAPEVKAQYAMHGITPEI